MLYKPIATRHRHIAYNSIFMVWRQKTNRKRKALFSMALRRYYNTQRITMVIDFPAYEHFSSLR